MGKTMGKSLAENQEESHGKVGVLGQKSQIPDFFCEESKKKKTRLFWRQKEKLSVRRNGGQKSKDILV